MTKLAVLISGSGSNLQAILDAIAGRRLRASLVGVLSSNANAYGLERARAAGLPTAVCSARELGSREAADEAMARQLRDWGADWIVLAGFMRILSPGFVQQFAGRIINIHPSLLPRHKGLHTHERALAAGDREHGCSIHLVNTALDDGPVIAQASVPVQAGDTVETLTERVHKSEHKLYPLVLGWLADGRLKVRDEQPWLDGKQLGYPVILRF